jgi:H+/gluconate symporter-like permease
VEITAWQNQEATLVDPYLINSSHFKKIRNIFHRGPVHPWPYWIVRMALAAIFICASVTKLVAPKAFAAIISAYGLVPEALPSFAALGLPPIRPDPR